MPNLSLFETDTIAAIATGLSQGGIGIIRISGKDSTLIGEKIYISSGGEKTFSSFSHGSLHYGFIEDPDSHVLFDEVMVAVMKGPHSYTREDVVEIHCHGGLVVLQKILNLVIRVGARLAEPGEFTKRAFLNGRIDLSKAEAVMDLISSENEFAASNSVNQLRGVIKDKVSYLREVILAKIAYIEAALDDPEHISLDGFSDNLEKDVCEWIKVSEDMIRNGQNGMVLSNGIRTVIVGKPNAGKSSILNALLRENRAIVTDIAGTTRDTLEETLRIGELSLRIVDTAGIRDTEDTIEKIGVEKSVSEIEKADLVLFVCDSSRELSDEDVLIAKEIVKQQKKAILLFNKMDLSERIDKKRILSLLSNCISIDTSAQNLSGLKDLEDSIYSLFVQGDIADSTNQIYMTSIRQLQLMEKCRDSLYKVRDSIQMGMPEDFLSIDLNDAYYSLGLIIGEEASEDVVNEIFRKFCMGK